MEDAFDRIDEALRPLALNNETAHEVYAALCNVAWVPDAHEAQAYVEARGDGVCAWSWRAAGGYVADLRDRGETYLDFYCSGNEGVVSDAVREAMASVGYRPVT